MNLVMLLWAVGSRASESSESGKRSRKRAIFFHGTSLIFCQDFPMSALMPEKVPQELTYHLAGGRAPKENSFSNLSVSGTNCWFRPP